MNASATALPRPPRHIPWGWLVPLVAALLVVAFLGGIVTGRSLAPASNASNTSSRAAFQPDASTTFVRSAPQITGTGPDLLEMAARSIAVLGVPVTGTGPDLVQVADYA
jgi:hypothetical protein